MCRAANTSPKNSFPIISVAFHPRAVYSRNPLAFRACLLAMQLKQHIHGAQASHAGLVAGP